MVECAAPPVTFCLSTGRCGTQWLADAITELAPPLEVTHEPIGAGYRPRCFFRRYDDARAILELDEVRAHLDWIEQLRVPYVETGWPAYAVLPLLASRFGKRLRVIHLTRHPVPTALSHATHNSFAGSDRHDAYTRWATLGPRDSGVFLPEYAERWSSLSPYERCLYWWTEVQLYALEFAARFPHVPLLRVLSERMLAGDAAELSRLTAFLELPFGPHWTERAGRVVDRWNHRTDQPIDPAAIMRHPVTIAVAGALGYAVDGLDAERLRARYARSDGEAKRATPERRPAADRSGGVPRSPRGTSA